VPAFGPGITIESDDGPLFTGFPEVPDATAPESFDALMARQIDDFARAISSGSRPEVDAEFATSTVALIERCAHEPRIATEPWWDHQVLPLPIDPAILAAKARLA